MESKNCPYRLRKVIPVLTKKDPICANNILLYNTKSNTFGRILSEEVSIRLLSKATPLMISRKHATINCKGDQAHVMDHNSTNGVYIDGKRIQAGQFHEVKSGQRIAFGCGVNNQPSEFEYILEQIPDLSFTNTPECVNTSLEDFTSPTKRLRLIDSPSLTIIESNSAQIKEQEDKITFLTEELSKKEQTQAELNNQLEETEKGLMEKLEKQKLELEAERCEAENRLQKLLEKQLEEKESLLRNEFDNQISLLQSEKDNIEKSLQEELSKKLSEKDEAYKQKLEEQKIALDKAMCDKENERNTLIAQLKAKESLIEKYKCVEENQKQLEYCLEELRNQINEKENQLVRQKEISKKVESEAKQNVIQTMEDEFTCIICQELFIGATTLSCAHTFCELCLILWSKKKKTCPVCRRRIKGKAVRSVVLDSAVDKMVETMDEENMKRRAELKLEREELKRRSIALEGPDGLRALIHLGDDVDEPEETPVAPGPPHRNRPPNRNRPRSRSRSPRNHRHRPYYDQREQRSFNQYNNNRAQVPMYQRFNPNTNSNHQQQQQQRINNNNYYYQNPNNYNNVQFFNSNIRCFYCGGAGHLDRFCPRR